jgi:O-antigen/teichoic acid export membrane protein
MTVRRRIGAFIPGIIRSWGGDPGTPFGWIVGGNRGLALGDQLIVSATNFITGVIVGRTCTKDEFGLYMLGLSIVLLVLDLQTSLISSPYMVYSPRLPARDRALYTGSALIQHGIVAMTVVSILAAGLLVVVPTIDLEGLTNVVTAVAVAVSFILLREFTRRVHFANLRFGSAIVLDLSVAIVQIGLLVGLYAQNLVSAVSAFVAIGVACGLGAVAAIYAERSNISIDRRRVVPDLRKNWSIGKWIFASGVLWTASFNLYPWILTYFHGASATGVWAACFGVVAIGNPFLLGIQNLIGPNISHSFTSLNGRLFKEEVKRFSILFCVSTLPLVLILSILGGWIVGFVYGEKYLGNGVVVTILSINIMVTAIRFSYSRALFVMDRAKPDFLVNLVALCVMMTIGIWCVKQYGPLGVAAGFLIGNVTASIMKFVVFEMFPVIAHEGKTI